MSSRDWNGNIPTELYRIIQRFVSDYDYYQLLNCSQTMFHQIKFETLNIVLNGTEAEQFINSEEFKELISTKIRSFRRQLKLNLKEEHLSRCGSMYGVITRFADSNISSENLDILCNRDFFQFRCIGLSFMFDSNNPDLSSLTTCCKDYNFSAFCSFKNVAIFRNQDLRSISRYPAATILKIEECPGVIDVSFLKFIDDLSLINCSGIEDISELKYNRKLTIVKCRNIKDIKSLFHSDHKVLRTDLLHEFSVEQMIFFKSLTLQESRITSLARLSTLNKVSLINCSVLNTLKGLDNVFIVILERCDNLTSLSGLENSRFVRLCTMQAITDFSPLKNLSRVEISNCDKFTNASDLENVHHLIIRQCNNLKGVAALGRVYRLEFHFCGGITSLQGLENVSEIVIYGLWSLIEILGLGNNRSISCKRVPKQFLEELSIILLVDQRYSKYQSDTNLNNPEVTENTVITQFFRNKSVDNCELISEY
jgi:hypothetical protein